jgi:rhodanese-related sulfurtransferase
MDHGLHAAAATEMTSLDLRAARIPIILHIRSSPLLEDFDHWTLFLGCHDGKALLYEAGFGAMEIGLAELLSRWDGNGIYVAGEPIEPLATKAAAAVQRVVFVILAGLAFAGVGLLARRTTAALPPTAARRLRSPLAVCLGVVCAGAAAAAAHHSASPQGFLRNPDTLRSVTTRFFTDFMESVTSEELDALIQNPGSAVVVDARSAGTFRTGLHIEGAINVPYTSSLANAASVLRSVETDKLIVVYCDNASCTFAGVVARKLHTIGYNNIKIYHNGWKGWVAYKNINQGELLFGKDTE